VNQHEDKKVMKISDMVIDKSIELKKMSQEQLQREFDYIQAEKLLRKMLQKGLITEAKLFPLIKSFADTSPKYP
jgi:nicotinic acid phosphoribosyltransferase